MPSLVIFFLSAAMLPGEARCQPTITGVSIDDNTSMRLRLAWGGGSRTRWTGRIWLDAGQVVSRSSLGLDPASPGAKQIEDGQLIVLPHTVTSFDGVDIECISTPDASLLIELEAADGTGTRYVKKIAIDDLVDGRLAEPMDERGNLISVQRIWGDRIRFEFLRDALVFSGGELLRFDVVPHLTGLPPNDELDVEIRLVASTGGRDEIWSQRFDVSTDASGSFDPLRELEIPLPDGDGAFDLECRVSTRGLGSPLFGSRELLVRHIQLVVIDDHSAWRTASPWETQIAFDPANPEWWDRLLNLPQIRVIPGIGQEPMGLAHSIHRDAAGRAWTELGPGGWVAYPLPIKEVGMAHRIEVEYMASVQQQLGVSLIEPNSAGLILPLGHDSAITTSPNSIHQPFNATDTLIHRMHVWPRTDVPFLLIYNLDRALPARFGAINVLHSPRSGFVRLDPVQDDAEDDVTEPFDSLVNPFWPNDDNLDDTEPTRRRVVAQLVDAPLLPESFSAPEVFDPVARRTLDDWHTFYLASLRLTESLNLQGKQGAVVSVLNEGSTIYPSRVLDPTPKYDSGAFFSTGQDPMRKDVLEMMFRMFDREDLKLYPQVEFSSPIPKLEEMLRAAQRDPLADQSILLVKDSDVLGNGSLARNGPRYNPLSPEVQHALLEIIEELVARYGHHRSFGGVVIRIGPNTFTHFPDEHWGYDFTTVHHYLLEQGFVTLQTDRDTLINQYYEIVRNRPDDYLQWRASRLTAFYARISEIVRRHVPAATVSLSPTNLFRDLNSVRHLYPEIRGGVPDLNRVLLGMGIDPIGLRQFEGVTLLQPQRVAAREEMASSRVEHHLAESGVADSVFANPGGSGVLFHHPISPMQLVGFLEQSPFDGDESDLLLFPSVSDGALNARRRFVQRLVDSDRLFMVEGSMLANTIHDEAFVALTREFQMIPSVPFVDVPMASGAATVPPVIMRRAVVDGQTYFYFLNRTPWQVTIDITVQSDGVIAVTPLTDREIRVSRPSGIGSSKLAVMRLTLKGYDLIGGSIGSPRVEFEDFQARYANPERIRTYLEEQLSIFQTEIDAAGSRPLPWRVLVNGGFEETIGEDRRTGWQYAHAQGVRIQRHEMDAFEGSHCLSMRSDGSNVAWIRSAPFSAPLTGRVSISVWLKLDGQTQPPLRLAIEGRHRGEEYYRYAEVGDPDRQVGSEWKRFGVHFDDLPPEGLTDVRIGFDLMGMGSVLIDGVQVHDLWLDDRDVVSLLKPRVDLLGPIERGDYVVCLDYLESYWAQVFLARPSARQRELGSHDNDRTTENSQPFSRRVLERVKSLAPQNMLPFR